MSLVLQLAVILVFVVLCVRSAGRGSQRPATPGNVLLLVAVASIVVLLVTIARRPGGAANAEIAWTGVESVEQPAALTVGGARDGATVGWPNGSFVPIVNVTGGPTATLDISGGGGFLRTQQGYVNGDWLAPAQAKAMGDFSVRLDRKWFWGRRLTIVQGNSDIATVDLFGFWGPGRDRVYAVSSLIEPDIVRFRASDPAVASSLENWAADLRILVTKEEVRILEPSTAYTHRLQLPGTVEVMWPRLTLPLRIRQLRDRIAMDFPPPWRLSSPLPPAAPDGKSTLIVTASPMPGDHAFVIPLGSQLSRLRHTVPLENGTFAGRRPPDTSDMETGIENITSVQRVEVGRHVIKIAAVSDLPSLTRLAIGLVLSIVMLLGGTALVRNRLRSFDQWILFGIIASLWSILVVRVMLAFRYAFEPAYLDRLAVRGLANALIALTVIPGLICIAAALQRDQRRVFANLSEQRRAGKHLLLYAVCLVVAGFVEAQITGSLWRNLPDAYHPVWGLSAQNLVWAILATLGLLLFLAAYAVFTYFRHDLLEGDGGDELVSRSPVLRLFRLLFWAIPNLFYKFANEFGSGIWPRIGAVEDDGDEGEDDRNPSQGRFVGRFLLRAFIFLLCWLPLIGVARWFNWIQDIVLPLAAVCVACVFLSYRLYFSPSSPAVSRFQWFPLFVVVVTLVFLSMILPPLGGDTGGIVAVCSVFLPLIVVLLAGGRPWRVPVTLAVTAALGLLLVVQVYLNLSVVLPYLGFAGQFGTRLLVFKEGGNVLTRLISSPVQSEAYIFESPTARSLSQAFEHVWENQALANQGGFTGLGYGYAPARRSQVPQQIVQYDSTYSFFILGEHGAVGGIALLLIYSVPLFLVLISARRQFDVGHGLAVIVASSFLLEAIAQAGMNLGIIPFTGRDLPFLSVNSTSDLPRWCILFCLIANSLQWRTTGDPEGFRNPFSMISAPEARTLEPSRAFYKTAGMIAAVPALLIAAVVLQNARTVLDDEKGAPFTWGSLLAQVDNFAELGLITVDPSNKTIVLHNTLKSGGNTLLEQEAARFNQLPESQRLVGGTPNPTIDVERRLSSIRNLRDYDRLMSDFRSVDTGNSARSRPHLFSLAAPPAWVDDDRTIPAADGKYRVEANPAYNIYATFKTAGRPEDFPTITAPAAGPSIFRISGRGFEFTMSGRSASALDEDEVTLQDDTQGGLTVVGSTSRFGSRVRVFLRFRPARPNGRMTTRFLGELEVLDGKVHFRREQLRVALQSEQQDREIQEGVRVQLSPGDSIQTVAAIAPGLQPQLVLGQSQGDALIGPAWVNGNWQLAYNGDFPLPWIAHLRTAVLSEWADNSDKAALESYSRITLDADLQTSLQRFVARRGREHHARLLAAFGPSQFRRYGAAGALPPRVAVAALSLPTGSVRAIAGWPAMNSTDFWQRGAGSEVIPPYDWIEDRAPRGLARRYGGDRNFDRIVVGSAGKPIWAAAALGVHPDLHSRLRVRGGSGAEDSLFGIPIGPRPWTVLGSRALNGNEWADFDSYLARSDNRYQVRLGFLALARPGASSGVATETGMSPSDIESFDGGQTPWRRFPAFPESIAFSVRNPDRIRALDETPLADNLLNMFGIGITRGDIQRRVSFWTRKEVDDWNRDQRNHFAAVSPEAADFGLDEIDTPRRFVNMLLGGDRNLWSNVDFAGAFATAVAGAPVLPHITADGEGVQLLDSRTEFSQVSQRLRPGLAAVITQGTASAYFNVPRVRGVLQALPRVTAYAKTGTLATGETRGNVSRLLLALVRWNAEGTAVEQGLVFSIVVEAADQGTATAWLADWIAENEGQLRRYFSAS
jgi:cell division protein FtsW (lipid II flippase)